MTNIYQNIFQNHFGLGVYTFGSSEYTADTMAPLIEVTDYLLDNNEDRTALVDLTIDRLICGDHPDDLVSYIAEAYGINFDHFFETR